MCCFDIAYKTSLTTAANALRLLSDKPVAKQVTWLEQYLPRWITMLLQWRILHIMFWQHVMGDDRQCLCVCVCGWCFVTGCKEWYHMCVNMYMKNSVFCQTVTDDRRADILCRRTPGASARIHTPLSSVARQQQLPRASGLVLAPGGLVCRVMN